MHLAWVSLLCNFIVDSGKPIYAVTKFRFKNNILYRFSLQRWLKSLPTQGGQAIGN